MEEHLAGVATVLVSPDGALGLVPLEALPGKAAGSYLIEDYTLALVPVPRLFGDDAAGRGGRPEAGAGSGRGASLLLVGDVDYGGDPGVATTQVASRSAAVGTRDRVCAELPGTAGRQRASRSRAIRDVVSSDRISERSRSRAFLRGEQATEEALRSRPRNIATCTWPRTAIFAPPELRSAPGRRATRAARQRGWTSSAARGVAGFHPGLLSGLALAGANVRPTPTRQG